MNIHHNIHYMQRYKVQHLTGLQSRVRRASSGSKVIRYSRRGVTTTDPQGQRKPDKAQVLPVPEEVHSATVHKEHRKVQEIH